MRRKLCLLSLLIVFIAAGCSEPDQYPYIDLSKPAKAAVALPDVQPKKEILKVGMITEMGAGNQLNYERFMESLAPYINRQVEIEWRRSYAELNNMLAFGSVDIALMPATSYLTDKDSYHFDAIAIGQPSGEETVNSLIIVPSSSRANDLSDLKGKTFAMMDPLSNASGMYLYFLLRQRGEMPDTFFKNYFFTYNSEDTIEAVASGMVDGAVVKNLTLSKLAQDNPLLRQKVRVIYTSPPLEDLVVVARCGLAAGLKQRFEQALFSAQNRPEGQEMLKKAELKQFRQVNNRDFVSTSRIVEKVIHR